MTQYLRVDGRSSIDTGGGTPGLSDGFRAARQAAGRRSSTASAETGPAPAIASHRNNARYMVSSSPRKVSNESTSGPWTAAMATIMTTPRAPAEILVMSPASSSMPPKNSTPDAKGASSCGAGMPQSSKFCVTSGRCVSLPQPVQMNTQPVTMRANSGPSHSRCRATRRGHSINASTMTFMDALPVDARRPGWSPECYGVRSPRREDPVDDGPDAVTDRVTAGLGGARGDLGNRSRGRGFVDARGVEADAREPRRWIREPGGTEVRLETGIKGRDGIALVVGEMPAREVVAQHQRVGLAAVDEPEGHAGVGRVEQ